MAQYVLTYGEVCTYDMEFDPAKDTRRVEIEAESDIDGFLKARAELAKRQGKYTATFQPVLRQGERVVAFATHIPLVPSDWPDSFSFDPDSVESAV